MKNVYEKCAICGKTIKPFYDDETFDNDNPESNSWNEGIVDTIFAGYGSKYEGYSFLITICDYCLEHNEHIKKLKNSF